MCTRTWTFRKWWREMLMSKQNKYCNMLYTTYYMMDKNEEIDHHHQPPTTETEFQWERIVGKSNCIKSSSGKIAMKKELYKTYHISLSRFSCMFPGFTISFFIIVIIFVVCRIATIRIFFFPMLFTLPVRLSCFQP